MTQTNTMYVVASSLPRKAHNIFREQLALLFGNFEVLEVEPFTFSESDEWIQEQLAPKEVSPVVRTALIQLTDGHPYYLNVLLRGLKRHIEDQQEGELSEEQLTDVLEQELFSREGTLCRYWEAQISSWHKGRFAYLYLDALLAVALGHKKLSQVARHVKRPLRTTKKILDRLVETESLDKQGSFYVIRDTLFNFWVREVYHLRQLTLEVDVESVRQHFRRSVHTWFERMTYENQKELSKRIEALFTDFRNDVVVLDNKKIKCPSFAEVHSKPSNGRVFPVVAKSAHSRWLCQVAYKTVKEDDVEVFQRDIQKVRAPVQRRIMIALAGIELNAKLLAQESRILIWDLAALNSLMSLYGHPKVVCWET